MPYIKIDVKELGLDLLSMSGHKFYGPKGVGALYIRNGVRLDKLICGGGQERSQRGGTTNTPAIVGMAKALQLALEEMEQNNKHMASLRDHFVERVLAEIPMCASTETHSTVYRRWQISVSNLWKAKAF